MTEIPHGQAAEDQPALHRRRARPLLGWTLAAMALLLVLFLAYPSAPGTHYSFFTADHPIDVDSDGSGRWYYYMPEPAVGGRTPAQLADAARAELLPQGYTEDTTNRPWFRFVKGDREVIVCNHDEIADGDPSPVGIHIIHEKALSGTPRQRCPVVHVREPGSNPLGLFRFKLQKLVYRW